MNQNNLDLDTKKSNTMPHSYQVDLSDSDPKLAYLKIIVETLDDPNLFYEKCKFISERVDALIRYAKRLGFTINYSSTFKNELRLFLIEKIKKACNYHELASIVCNFTNINFTFYDNYFVMFWNISVVNALDLSMQEDKIIKRFIYIKNFI